MRVRDFECRNYEEAERLLGKRSRRVVCNNTVLERVGPRIFVELHGHAIVAFELGYPTLYSHCGWPTVTTKQRLNRCLPDPWRVCQENWEWKLYNYETGETAPWVNGPALPEAVTVE